MEEAERADDGAAADDGHGEVRRMELSFGEDLEKKLQLDEANRGFYGTKE